MGCPFKEQRPANVSELPRYPPGCLINELAYRELASPVNVQDQIELTRVVIYTQI